MVLSNVISEQLISDNGTKFKSQEFKNFIKTLGMKHIQTATYHQMVKQRGTFKQWKMASRIELLQ